jgi:hypothetical protein
MVVVDKLTKATNFIPVKTTHKEKNIAKIPSSPSSFHYTKASFHHHLL